MDIDYYYSYYYYQYYLLRGLMLITCWPVPVVDVDEDVGVSPEPVAVLSLEWWFTPLLLSSATARLSNTF